jgi:hypothetical protein
MAFVASYKVVSVTSLPNQRVLDPGKLNVVVVRPNLAFRVKVRNSDGSQHPTVSLRLSPVPSHFGSVVTRILAERGTQTVTFAVRKVPFAVRERVVITVGSTSGKTAISAAYPVIFARSSHKSYVTVPLRAQQTSIVGAYDLLHRLGLRVELTRQTMISSLYEPSAKLFPRAGTRVPGGSVVQITPTGGPLGSPAVLKSNPHYRVPDFTGRPASAAIRWAEDRRMFWSIPELPALKASNAPHLFDAYRVTAQQPKPGGTIVQGVMVGRGFKPTPLTLSVVQTSR